jgi:chromosome segregation ATPase
MMEDKLKQQVEDVVTAIFASKEKETIRQRTEDALQASADKIQDLTEQVTASVEAVEAKDVEVAELKEQIETAAADTAATVEAHEVVVKDLTEAKEAVEAELEKVTLELSTMKQEITADKRMAELSTAGVVREAADVQKAKVMVMSDEEFAAYQEELVSIKAQVIESLKGKEKASDAEDDVDTDDTTPPANVDPGKTAQAALNLESQPSQDLAKKYADLGKAMADAIKNK